MSNVARTIISQIGNRAFAMLGAGEIVSSEKERYIRFGIGRNCKKVTHIQVTLAEDDTYTVKFDRQPSVQAWARGAEIKTLAAVDGVYFDQLRPVIEEHTGLYTNL